MLVPVNQKSKKVIGCKKFPVNVPAVSLDNVSFHSKEGVLKWKYVYHWRIAVERELSKLALKCCKIMELLEDAQVKKIVSCISLFCRKLAKELIMNL